MSNEGDEEKERATNTDHGREEWRAGGLTKREGLLVALVPTFTFFTSSPLSQWFLKSAMAVPHCDWWIFVWSSRSLDLPPPLIERILSASFFFSLLSFVPYFVPLFLAHMVLFARSPRVLSPFLGLSPPERTVSLSSNPSDTSRHGRSPYVTDTIPLE